MKKQINDFKILTEDYADIINDMNLKRDEIYMVSRKNNYKYGTDSIFTLYESKHEIQIFAFQGIENGIALSCNGFEFSLLGKGKVTIEVSKLDQFQETLDFLESFKVKFVNSFIKTATGYDFDMVLETNSKNKLIINTAGSGEFEADRELFNEYLKR